MPIPSLHAWLTDMDLVPAGGAALVDRYVGYYEPDASSHDAPDRDADLVEEVRNVARTLAAKVAWLRAGNRPADHDLEDPWPK